MKDAHRRRQKAESVIAQPLPTMESGHTLHPTKQERLVMGGPQIGRMDVQRNDFIVTSNTSWAVNMYELGNEKYVESGDLESNHSYDGHDGIKADAARSPAWMKSPVDEETMINVKFIANDIVACTYENGSISTWCARTGAHLSRVKLRHMSFSWAMCKINDQQFVTGSLEGHVCVFTHRRGREVKEVKRIRKAHSEGIVSLAACDDFVVSASVDGTACLWDAKQWRRITTLHHNGPVYNCTVSQRYVMTNSAASFGCVLESIVETIKRELRIYRIDEFVEDCTLVKLYLADGGIWMPRFVGDDLFMCWLDNEDRRELLAFFKLDSESDLVVAQVKVGCLWVLDYALLDDGRLVACGDSRSSGVIATLPRALRKLITRETGVKQRFCTIV